ncbi:MAG: protein kinase [Planctomycetes bacterium]|nr:protein kinase [Planctomycetota bacterium]
MPEAQALYRCVCGTDVPVGRGGEARCPSCGRRQRVSSDAAAAETVVLAAGKREATPAASAEPAGAHDPRESRESREPRADASRQSLVGQVIDHFEVLEELGRGGMGTVYRALDRSLERYVALKVLDSEEARKQRDLVEAFVHEARTQARMNHPGITTIHYIGRFQDMTYFAMEIVPGMNLEARLKQGPIPFREVVRMAIQVVQALKEASDRGVIHRDIKPGNIILSRSGRVKVTDFGLSKTEKGGLQITGGRHITGTPYYIAPEQARGETTDFRTDIYSLGATLYHLAYGRAPFDGENFLAVISRHLSEPVRFPEHPPADVAPGFPAILERMMAKRPEDRFQSYEELEEALMDVRPEAQVVAAVGRRAVATLLDYAAIALVAGFFFGVLNILLDTRDSGQISALTHGVAACLTIGDQVYRRATLGKLFGKLRIARLDGRPVERWRLLARGVFQFFPLLALSAFSLGSALGLLGLRRSLIPAVIAVMFAVYLLDQLWALTNRKRRTLHDLVLGTWVLEKA